MQEKCDKRRLSVGGHQSIDLILDGLHTGFQFVMQAHLHDLVLGCLIQSIPEFFLQLFCKFFLTLTQIFPQMLDIDALAAVLVAGHCRNDLGGHGTCHLKALGRLDHLAVDGSAVVQHVLDIDQTTVEDRLDEIIRIMEMQYTVVVRHGNMLRQKQTSGNVTGHFARNIVSLSGSQTGILVGIFLRQLLILIPDQF